MTAPTDALTRIDFGLALPGDRVLADVLERHCRDDWSGFDARLAAQDADRCVICGQAGYGPECGPCTADWDRGLDRAVDL